MAVYRDRKVTVKFTPQELLDCQRFLTHSETRTMSRLIRRALYDYRKSQTGTATKTDENPEDRLDLANAKKLKKSMSDAKPAKRGRPIDQKPLPVYHGLSAPAPQAVKRKPPKHSSKKAHAQ